MGNADDLANLSGKEPIKHETPLERINRLHAAQSTTEVMMKGSIWNFHYSEDKGSDPIVMAQIEAAMKANLPFGLKCFRSRVVFIPHKLKAYWIWNDNEHGPVFAYKDRDDMITGIKFQYLGHKEFITTAELAALAKIILYSNAIENLESWRGKILPESAHPPRPMEPGESGI